MVGTEPQSRRRNAAFRALRAFLDCYERETDEVTAIRKVRVPKIPQEPLEGTTLETVKQLVKVCERGTFAGDRDTAILYALFDTGCRAREFLAVNVEDVSTTGDILIRQAKGGKYRRVFIGRTARKALRRYLKYRQDDHPALWVTHPRCTRSSAFPMTR